MTERTAESVGTDTAHFLVISRISGRFKRRRHRVQSIILVRVQEQIKVQNLLDKDVKDEYVNKLIERYDGLDELYKIIYESHLSKLLVITEVCSIAKRRKVYTYKARNVYLDDMFICLIRRKLRLAIYES